MSTLIPPDRCQRVVAVFAGDDGYSIVRVAPARDSRSRDVERYVADRRKPFMNVSAGADTSTSP